MLYAQIEMMFRRSLRLAVRPLILLEHLIIAAVLLLPFYEVQQYRLIRLK